MFSTGIEIAVTLIFKRSLIVYVKSLQGYFILGVIRTLVLIYSIQKQFGIYIIFTVDLSVPRKIRDLHIGEICLVLGKGI
jgi:hypothetical protein